MGVSFFWGDPRGLLMTNYVQGPQLKIIPKYRDIQTPPIAILLGLGTCFDKEVLVILLPCFHFLGCPI